MSRSITQKEIARRLGVSQSLVSRALAGKTDDIGAAAGTVRRIRQMAADCGYRPSAAALTLRGAPTQTIGVVVKDFDDPFFGHFIGELQLLTRQRNHTLILTGAAETDFAALSKHAPDGLMILGSDFVPAGLDRLLAEGLPAVRIGQGVRQSRVLRVAMDEEAGLTSLVVHLLELGHLRLGYIGTTGKSNRRRAGLLRGVLRKRKLDNSGAAFLELARPVVKAGYEGMRRLLALPLPLRPTAVLAADDEIAFGALRAAASVGVQIPDEVSLTGVDDISSAAMAVPSLTTVRQPVREMIRLAFAMLVGEGVAQSGEVQVRPELIVRESTGRAPASKKGK
jgi:DNA-binding LacI/PurR family transcriptional regulator